MSAAALVLLAAGVGVGYGWQPMSDGSNRYEYLVQVEPELLDTLREGQSIPIVSEVPEGVGPIGRIRITVGHGDLPRQRLVTDRKPETGSSAPRSTDGIELTQYNQYPAPTYAQPQSPAPQYPQYDASPASINDAVDSWNGGDTTPAAGQPAGNPLRVAAAQAPPTTAPPATTWNGGVAPAPPASTGPFGKMGDGLDRVTQPLRNGLDQVDNSVRDAASNLGDKTRKLASDLTQPITGGTTWGGDAQAPAAGGMSAAPTWNGGAQTSPPALPAARATDAPTYSWNNEQPPTNGSTAAPFAATTPQSSAPADSNRFTVPPATQGAWPAAAVPTSAPATGSQRLDESLDPRDVGRWGNRQAAPAAAGPAASSQAKDDLEAPPLATGGRYGNTPQPQRTSAPPTGLPSDWAADTGVTPRSDGRSAPTTGAPFGPGPVLGPAGEKSTASGGTPTIEKRMLNQPANRQLEGVAGNQPSSAFPAGPPLASSTPLSPGPTSGAAPTGAAGQGWDQAARNPQLPQIMQAGAAAPPAANGPHAMTVLAAWVLLSGSAAGNLYLFWSYLDVRTKYRALVRKTARAVGSRFSAA